MSTYHNILCVKCINKTCKCDNNGAYFTTSLLYFAFGLFNIAISITGAVILNYSEYEQEDDICFQSFLFNFLMTVYSVIYGISLFYSSVQ
jgi:hypothetical protein